MNHYFISITFMSIKQVEYQLENIVEAIDAEFDKFAEKEYIISGSASLDDDETIDDGFVETDPEKFFDEYQGDDQPIDDDRDEKRQNIEAFITFIGTQKGRAQVERMKKSVDTRLDEFAEKGLIVSYSWAKLRESDRTSEFSEEEIQAFQKEHNTRIRRNT